MRIAVSTFGLFLALGVLAGLGAPGTAWSQPGTVLSEQKLSDSQGNFTGPLSDLDEFGGAVVGLGDLDGAGPSTVAVAIGAVGDDDGGGNRGAVYILFLDGTGNVLSEQKISDTQGNFTATIDNSDDFGCSLAYLGDLDGAGPSVATLAVGAAGDDDGGTDRGAVYILFLASTGNVLSYQKISDTQGNFTATIFNADEVGGAVAFLGDLDGAGTSVGALAVGSAPFDDGGINRGAVYIMFLNSAGSVVSYQRISRTAGGLPAIIDTADEFGSSVAGLGDLDGAGTSVGALLVGAIGDDDGGSDRGAIYVLFLDNAGMVLSYQKISDLVGNFLAPLDNLDEFGGAVANLGDLDPFGGGNTVTAVAVGAIGDDDGGQNRGATYVLFLDSTGNVTSWLGNDGTVHTYHKISDSAGNLTSALADGDEFGGAVAALGDLDGDGEAEQVLVVGASFDDEGGEDRGAAYVLFLDGVDVVDASELPPGASRHRLGQARPNPFNPSTSIPYELASSGRVEIDIFDVEGRLVRKLAPGPVAAGTHVTLWNGLDDRGRRLASGSYFYRLSVDGRIATAARRAVLLK